MRHNVRIAALAVAGSAALGSLAYAAGVNVDAIADGQGKEMGATVQPEPANFWYPTSRWRPGEVVRQQTLRLPWFPGEKDFALGVGVVAGADPGVAEAAKAATKP